MKLSQQKTRNAGIFSMIDAKPNSQPLLVSMTRLLSPVTVAATGLLCKAFLNSGLCSITVNNLHILLDAIRDDERRRRGQGVVTGMSPAS